jgi:hypothetical protein
MKRSRGSDASAVRGDSSENPRLPGTTEPFSLLPQGEAPGLRPDRSVAILSAPATERAVAFSAHSARSIHLHILGSMETVVSGPKQVAVRISPEGDPALFRVRSHDLLPVTVFTGAPTDRPSSYHISHLFRKHKGSVRFFIKKIDRRRSGYRAFPVRGCCLFPYRPYSRDLGFSRPRSLIYQPAGLIFGSANRVRGYRQAG